MKIVKWRLQAGSKQGQESANLKLQKGLDYVELLKQTENVVSVENTGSELIIKIEEA